MRRELTNQQLLDRYIHAVKMMLPPDKMEDIAAEVRSNLESQVEDHAMALGRDLRPDEVSAILKQHGHPANVAHQYREQPGRGLIGPALFPFYWFTLRAILAVWVTIRVIVVVFALQGTSPVGTILLALGRDVLLAGIIIPAGVTLLFAVWEYLEFKFRYSERWKPEALGPVPPPCPQLPKHRPMVEIVGGIAWLILGRWRCTHRGSSGCGAEEVFSALPRLFTRCDSPCGCWLLWGFSVVAGLHAVRRGQVAAGPAQRRGRRGSRAGDFPPADRRSIGRGSEVGPNAGRRWRLSIR